MSCEGVWPIRHDLSSAKSGVYPSESSVVQGNCLSAQIGDTDLYVSFAGYLLRSDTIPGSSLAFSLPELMSFFFGNEKLQKLPLLVAFSGLIITEIVLYLVFMEMT